MALKEKEILDAELLDLRAKHGKVREMIVFVDEDDDEKTARFFLRPLDKLVRKMILDIEKTSVERAVLNGIKTLQLGGDNIDILLDNDYAMVSANAALNNYMLVRSGIIKKN